MFLRAICFLAINYFLAVGNIFSQESNNFIYGKVTTDTEKVYTGYISWGDGSFLWANIFNADKISNPYYDYVPEDKKNYRKRIVDQDGRVRIVNRNYYIPTTHVFDTRFGNIRSIEKTEDGTVYVELKNEKFLPVKNRTKDLARAIYVNDINLGKLRIDWYRFKKVEFMSAPADISFTPGKAIYGTVNCDQGVISGFIFWDRDEKMQNEKLDGQYDGNKVAVKFENIKSITKLGDGCELKLINDQKLFMTGSNDVNHKNRGLFVYMPNTGIVTIDWDEFISASFEKEVGNSGISYTDFKPTKRLCGTVYLKDSTQYKGVIVFDLDEAMDSEILDGSNEGLKYRIPFKYIKSVEPLSREFSKVELKNGAKLVMGNSTDVNYRNDGVLVFKSSTDYEFLYWDEVDRIDFE